MNRDEYNKMFHKHQLNLVAFKRLMDCDEEVLRLVNAAIEAERERLAQPEQEPVAWMHNDIEGNVIAHRPSDIDRHPERWTALYPEPKPCPTCEALARTVMLDQTSHDTTPPRREWQGLTGEEIADLTLAHAGYPVRLTQAIEAKLREKNA